MKKTINIKQTGVIILIILLFSIIYTLEKDQNTPKTDIGSAQIERAYLKQQSNVQVQGSGMIIKILRDDLHGTKHQKFIVRITKELTVLIAHNIDLAPRVETLAEVEIIEFYGEYEWNKKGGVIHWTHHAPGNNHPDGWLKYKDRLYQ